MIYFDTTNTGSARHRSGLTRVSARLREELGPGSAEVKWPWGDWPLRRDDWIVTAELFSEAERPGIGEFLRNRPCRVGAIFHDAIPLKHPHITWPKSVARHPGYMKLLSECDRIWAVSGASRDELTSFWKWQGVDLAPPVDVLPLGADYNRRPRITQRSAPPLQSFVCVGIVEPRKNQSFLLDVCDALWRDGRRFELHIIGRVNPHFGPPIVARIKALRRIHDGLHFHAAVSDAVLDKLYARCSASVFPSIAEGCGLPLLESLWMGVPAVCSDLPALRENADGGGCAMTPPNDSIAWAEVLCRVLTDPAYVNRLSAEACTRPLPTWAAAAASVRATCGG